jgi:hypothetical protein
MRANLLLFWIVGFLGLGSLSALGAASLFPLPLAIVLAITVMGLGSALAYQFRATGNLLFLLVSAAMILVASFLDGVSVWEMLNLRQNAGVAEVRAEEAAAVRFKDEVVARVGAMREEIALLVREATNMDNDGRPENDHLIAGQLAQIESRKADLANLEAQANAAREKVGVMAAAVAGKESATHYFLQMANASPEPARWLILRATLFFLPLEFALALLAWSLHEQRPEAGAPVSRSARLRGTPAPGSGAPRPSPGAPIGTYSPARLVQPGEPIAYRPFNLNRLRQHLRQLRREGVIPVHRITSEAIDHLSRSEAIALCEEFGRGPCEPIRFACAVDSPTRAMAIAG